MSVIFRPAAFSDIPYLYTICLETGDSGKDATGLFYDPWLLGQIYSAPYFFHDLSLCFVAEEDFIPKGYIIGTENTSRFSEWYEKEWLPPLRHRYPENISPRIKSETEKNLISKIWHPDILPGPKKNPWIQNHPAHLHIDLLPDLQGMGCGRTLMELFLSELKKRACPGVHLGVIGTNTGAIAFYKKMEFSVLEDTRWGMVMGKILQ
jgi:ribosomal protein S18 acetylase RimI-like enzyme